MCCFGFVLSTIFLPTVGRVELSESLPQMWVAYGLCCLYLLSFIGGLFWILRTRPAKWYYALPFLAGMPVLAAASFHLLTMSAWLSEMGFAVPAFFAFPVACLLFSLLLIYPLSSKSRECILVIVGISAVAELYSLAAFGLSAVSPCFAEYFSADPNMLMFLRGICYLVLFPITGLLLSADVVERLKENDR